MTSMTKVEDTIEEKRRAEEGQWHLTITHNPICDMKIEETVNHPKSQNMVYMMKIGDTMNSILIDSLIRYV